MAKAKNQRFHRRVPVKFKGMPTSVMLSDIPQKDWTSAHGTTLSGQKVNSARFSIVGDSAIIQQGETGAALSIDSAEAELLGVELARHFGYTVTPPALAQQA